MDQLSMLRAFVAAAQHRSFSQAAASLGVTTGSISKAVAKLEASLQMRVLHRTTRSVTLTEAAEPYFLSCCRLLEELDEATRRVTREREVDSGGLRLVVHPMFVNGTFSSFIARYHALAPNVNLMVTVQDGAVNLYDGQVDMVIGPAGLVGQSAVIRRTLSASARILVASPAYLCRSGTPAHVSGLARHFLLVDPQSREKGTHSIELMWEGRRVAVQPTLSMDGNEAVLRMAALSGTGIAMLPEDAVREDIASGRLLAVLPGCSTSASMTDVEMFLFYAHREMLPARFRTFIDFCVEFFRSESSLQQLDAVPAQTDDTSDGICALETA
jgi:DNA-binding transcriptional LysR family regulator